MSQIVLVVISIVITVAIILIAKLINRVKFKGLTGSHKIVVVVCLLAIAGELVYLSTSFGLLVYVFEIIASIGVGLVVLGIAFQNKLKNAAAGLSIYLGPRINLGDIIEIDNKVGVVKEIHLTKTIIELNDGNEMWIPNVQFDEKIVITHKGNKQG
jgi:small-conductance mechanosensitive channel